MTDDAVIAVIRNVHKGGVTAGDDERVKRRFQFGRDEIICGNVTVNMMDGYERFASRICQPLCKRKTDKQCADKPRCIGHGDRVDVVKGDICLCERFRHYAAYRLRVSA